MEGSSGTDANDDNDTRRLPDGKNGFSLPADSFWAAGAATLNPGAWSEILADQGLEYKSVAGADNSDITLVWSPIVGSNGKLGPYEFSSEKNPDYFQSYETSQPSLVSKAWAGADGKSAVLLARPPPRTPDGALSSISFYDAVLPAFGLYDVNTSDVLKSFIRLAPDWIPPVTLKDNAVDDRSQTPTNAVWCFTCPTYYEVSIALTYRVSVDVKKLLGWLTTRFGDLSPAGLSGSTVDLDITLTKLTNYRTDRDPETKKLIDSTRHMVSILCSVDPFDIHLDFSGSGVKGWLVPHKKSPGGNPESIVDLLQRAFGSNSPAVQSTTFPDADDASDANAGEAKILAFGGVYPWYVGLGLDRSAKLSWRIGILTSVRISNDQDLVLAFSYDSSSGTFIGRAVFKPDLPSAVSVRDIYWDPRLDPVAALPRDIHIKDGVDIFQLVGLSALESVVPAPTLSQAQVTFKKGVGAEPMKFTIYGRFTMAPIKDSLVPAIFEWTNAALDLEVTKTKTTTDYKIKLANQFRLTDGASFSTFAFSLQCTKKSKDKTWMLEARARDLTVRSIAALFDDETYNKEKNVNNLEVVDKLAIKEIYIFYTFSSGPNPKASSFDADGVITLGDLSLDLHFHRTPTDWFFSATLSANSSSSTIGDIAESIVPGASDKLPAFVGDIRLDPRASAGGRPIGCLEFKCDNDKTKGSASVFTVFFQIAGFSLTFLQYKTRLKDGKGGIVKRILRISCDQLPAMDKVPLVGKLGQPFDHLTYLWVQDGNADSTLQTGITKDDLADINGLLASFGTQWTGSMPAPSLPPFQVKDTSSGNATTPSIALAKGHHFQVVISGKVVLDHVFETDRSDSKPPVVAPSRMAVARLTSEATLTPPGEKSSAYPEAQPTKGSTSKTVGPLTVNGLTFQYRKGHLIISIDATLRLGGLVFSVIGFTLDLDLQHVRLDDLASIVTKGFLEVNLHGIQVGLTQGPLTLDGVFIHDKSTTYESYRGGIAVGIKAWQVLAVGEYYVHLDDKGHEDYKAVFVYGKLDGPLIELEFATISGVRVGFGYNYTVRPIEVDELTAFPLISDTGLDGAGNDPLVVLNAFLARRPDGKAPFVYPERNSNWFAAGMTITAFDVLSLTAALLIEWNSSAGSDGGLSIRMLADGVFQMEPLASPDVSLFYVELVVQVDFDFGHGFIAASAAIAPSSHIYVPYARLSGSAAFYTWFGSNPHAGDWVVSIGGYARNYRRPDHYPPCKRVSINFTVGDGIQMLGEAYCAVTPKCVMAGGALHMALRAGPVGASADLIFDAFINFQPFHFRAGISISVRCYVDIDIGLIHINIDIHVGADLTVWGPNDFGGHAHVNFWFFGFDIDFGARETIGDGISLNAFRKMLERPGPGAGKPSEDTVGGVDDQHTLHKYSVEAGLAPQTSVPIAGNDKKFPSTGAMTTFAVNAGTMTLRIDCSFALTSATLKQSNSDASTQDVSLQLPTGQGTPPRLYAWPMHCEKTDKVNDEIFSHIDITIRKDDVSGTPIIDGFRAELVLKSASTALWKVWSLAADPLLADSTPDDLKSADNGTVDLVQAVRIRAPESRVQRSRIVDMDAAAAMMETIPGDYHMAPIESQGAASQPSNFEVTDARGHPIAGPQRWQDFQKTWAATNSSSATSRLALLADALEWTIRPPEQMTHDAGRADNGMVLQPGRPANAPRVRSNNRTDFDLVDRQPEVTMSYLGVYYPALPQVCV